MAGYDVQSIYLDLEENIFEDMEGNVVYDIFKYLTPNQLLLLRGPGGTLYTDGPPGVKYEIVIPF